MSRIEYNIGDKVLSGREIFRSFYILIKNKKVDRSGEKMYYKCNQKCTINVTIEKGDAMDVEIDNRIAEFRKELGLSQHRLAQAVGLKRRSIMAYENKTISPTLETAYKISKVLGKDLTEVFIFK